MRNFIIRLIINAIALAVAATYVEGIHLTGGYMDLLGVAFVFGLVNALVKPIVFFFSLPFLFLSLGLLAFVLNGAMLLLTAALLEQFSVDGLLTAVVGSLVISVVSIFMGLILKDDKKKK
jgi:putative membrane protein